MEHSYDFDLAVIGSGPGGQKAAIMAALALQGAWIVIGHSWSELRAPALASAGGMTSG